MNDVITGGEARGWLDAEGNMHFEGDLTPEVKRDIEAMLLGYLVDGTDGLRSEAEAIGFNSITFGTDGA